MEPTTKKTETERLLEILRGGSQAEKLEALRIIGLIDEDGKVTERYANWGREVSHASDEAGADPPAASKSH